ncbi:DUF3810 domain-containing protein [Parasediminibacterium paludis]|uniref:DUF3810 domain-containing protein n=1 Tax=Parasediminibacterium paludis TaxID=908966 RepID=A0ABV8PZ20_9BACT
MKVTHTSTLQRYKSNITWIIPLVFAIFLFVISLFPAFIEKYYSNNYYIQISELQRIITHWVPFSVGDIGYFILILYIIFCVVKFVIRLITRQLSWRIIGRNLLKCSKFLLWVYVFFNLFWGLNYTRLGIAYQLQLSNSKYSTQELHDFTCEILDKLNDSRLALGDSNYQYPSNNIIYSQAFDAYQATKQTFHFINYKHFSVKPSLLSTMVSYAGYSGYYNPFSGEAQLNTDLPKFITPFVTCHEMAHQLGYASESEANFVGFLAATHSNNPLFVYSAYFDMFMSANGALFEQDFYGAYLNLKQLNSLTKRDRKAYRDYVLGKQNNIQPVMSKIYDQYLKANQQKSGIKSYNEVIDWLIAYKKKYGTF